MPPDFEGSWILNIRQSIAYFVFKVYPTYIAVMTAQCKPIDSLEKKFSVSNLIPVDDDLSKDPERLASLVGPLCVQMLSHLNYPGAPKLKDEAIAALLDYMLKRATEIGVPLDTPISSKGFRLGYAEGLVCFLGFSMASPLSFPSTCRKSSR